MFQCFICANLIELNDELVVCSGVCNRKYHRKCTNLSEKEFEAIRGSKALFWNCDLCLVLCNEYFSAQVNRIFDEKFGKFFINSERKFDQLYNRLNDIEGNRYIEYPTSKSKDKQTPKSYHLLFNRKALIITGVITLLTIVIGALILANSNVFKTSTTQSKQVGDGDDSRKNIPINSNIGKDNIGGGRVLRLVPRDGWLAQPPSSKPVALKLPVSRVVVISTQTESCETQAACTFRVRFTQSFNIESSNYDDIIYNFLIGGDGNVYEGRGWDHMGAVLKGHNDDSISFAYIGTFKQKPPNAKQLNVTQLLLEEGVKLGKLSVDYQIIAANIIEPTSLSTSADALYASFKGWPHWLEV